MRSVKHQKKFMEKRFQITFVHCIKPFNVEEISDKIAFLLATPNFKAEIKIIYQGIDNLHAACPESSGDWYFYWKLSNSRRESSS